ncbi:MAG: 30S ribosomal protein S6 [Silvanigrellaceae bacterium]|nr:30S ribosomal protein S6 [Silvanigrellaceae bacterium]
MREYEAMIIAKSDLPESELSKMVLKWEGIINNDGGQIIKKDTWGVRRLAYPIKKQNRGNYFVYDIASTQDNVLELERSLKFDENVLRSMILKLSDSVNVEDRRIELQKQAEAAAQRAAEAARERAETESLGARRGHGRDEE